MAPLARSRRRVLKDSTKRSSGDSPALLGDSHVASRLKQGLNTESLAMISRSVMSQNVSASDVKKLLQSLRDRGVVILEGRIFVGDGFKGAPPAEAMVPGVVMKSEATSLSETEMAAAILVLRRFVLAVIDGELQADPMLVELAEAYYRVDPTGGIDLEIEMHGLVNRITRVSLN